MIAILWHWRLWSGSTVLLRVDAIARDSTLQLLLTKHQLGADGWVQVVILLELDVARAMLALEDREANLCRILILSSKLRHSQHAFHDLSSDHCFLAQAWRQYQHVHPHALACEGLLDPRQEVALQLVKCDDLHLWNIVSLAARQRQVILG